MNHWTDKPNPEFEQWWATKTAAGYQYGREALENVRFGFEGAQSLRWQPIETAPMDGTRIILGSTDNRLSHRVREGSWWHNDGTWSTDFEPTHWMPLPDPPSKENS